MSFGGWGRVFVLFAAFAVAAAPWTGKASAVTSGLMAALQQEVPTTPPSTPESETPPSTPESETPPSTPTTTPPSTPTTTPPSTPTTPPPSTPKPGTRSSEDSEAEASAERAIADAGGLVPGRDPVNVDVDDLFSGTEGAHFTATSSNPEVATAEITPDQRVKVTPVGIGTATITVTMTEAGGGDKYSVEFEVTVASAADNAQANVDRTIIDAGGLVPGRDPVNVDVKDLFEDTEGTDGGDFRATSSNPEVATVEITPNPHVKITPVGIGTATISVVTTAGGNERSVEFEVTVARSVPALPLVATGLLGMLLFGAGAWRRLRRR